MEDEIKDMKQLTNDELLTLYTAINDHISYLNQQIIEPIVEENEEKSEGETDE